MSFVKIIWILTFYSFLRWIKQEVAENYCKTTENRLFVSNRSSQIIL